MLKKIVNQPSFFSASYFMEAPGDENDAVQVTVAPRRNRGTDYGDDTNTVTVGPRANRGSDYTQDDQTDELAEETPTEEPTQEDDTPTEPDTGDDEATDYGGDGDDEEEEPTDDEGDAPDEPDTGDDGTDYTDDGDNEGEPTDDEGETDELEMTDAERIEAEKKYKMYTRFIHLYNLLENFKEKTRNIVKPNSVQNSVIKTVTNSFSDLSDILFDFMTIKYKTSSYVKIHLFFETVISVIQLNFELLKNNKINLKQ